jgi:hypothetical protein
MSTPYNPTGQVPPTDEYTLPQDVVDLVVAESVNNPFVVGADNIAWLLLAFATSRSLKNYGAVGDGSTNDTVAIQNAATAGGLIYVPDGTYRTTGDIAVPAVGATFWGPGTIAIDHPTNHFFVCASDDTKLKVIDVSIEGQQLNSGNIFRATGADCSLSLTRCNVNTSEFLTGRLTVGFDAVSVAAEDSRLVSGYTLSAFWLSATRLKVDGGRVFAAPGATVPLVGNSGSGGRVNLSNVRFSQAATGPGGASFVDVSTGKTIAVGCSFDVDSSGAGGATYAFKLNGGQLNNSGCAFDGDCLPYLFGLPCASGSIVQPGPGILFNAAADATIAIPDGAASVRITSTVSVAPEVRLPNTLSEGQPFSVSLFNGGGSTWSGEVAWKKADGTQALTEDTTVFAGLEVGESFTMSFVVVEIASGLYWQQVGKVAVLT